MGLKRNHGGIAGCLIEGVGSGRRLYTLDEDYPATTTPPVGSLWRYDAANYVNPWTKTPDSAPYDDSVGDMVQNFPRTQYGGVSFKYIQNVGSFPMSTSACVARDSSGNWYITEPNYRGYGILDIASQKAYGNLLKIDPSGTLVFASIRDWGCREPMYNPTGVAVDSARNRIAVSSSSLIFGASGMIADHGGIHIVNSATLDPETVQKVWPPAVSLAVGNGGTILRKTRWTGIGGTGGTSAWTQVGVGVTSADLKAVACQQTMWDSGSNLAYAVGGNVVLRSQDAGATWAVLRTVTDGANTVQLRGVKAFPYKKNATGPEADYVHIVGVSIDDGGNPHAYFSRMGGSSREAVPPEAEPYGLNCTWQTLDRREVTYICGDHGTIVKTNNYGGDYWMLESGTTENLNSICEVWHDGGGFNNTIWCVGDNGTVLRAALWLYATDGSFSQVPIPANCQTKKFVSVCQTTSKVIKILASDGTVLKTTNGEAASPTWIVVPPPVPGLSAMFFEDTASGLVVGPGGAILKTSNGGATWTSETSGVSTDLNGVYVQPITEMAESWYNQWSDVAFDAAGNLYAPDSYNVSILRVWSPPDGPNSMTTSSKAYAQVVPTSGNTSQPSTPVVTDDGAITWDGTRLHATWTASVCPNGDAIAEYRYAISAVPMDIGHDYVVAWTSAGTGLSVNRTGLNLAPGTYYFLVRAKCGAGVWSGVGVSDGIKVLSPGFATTISQAKTQSIGSLAVLKDVVTTARFDAFQWLGEDKFNVSEAGGDSGVMAQLEAASVPAVGDQVSLMGFLRVGSRGETMSPSDDTVYVDVTDIQTGSIGLPPPVVCMTTTRGLGGAPLGLEGGVEGGIGVNNIGLLARVFGAVTGSGMDPNTFISFIYLDDGSGVPNDSGDPAIPGVKCYLSPALGVPYGFATVTGISGRQYDPTSGKVYRIVWATECF